MQIPARGELVDIGGYQLQINCIGMGSLPTTGRARAGAWTDTA